MTARSRRPPPAGYRIETSDGLTMEICLHRAQKEARVRSRFCQIRPERAGIRGAIVAKGHPIHRTMGAAATCIIVSPGQPARFGVPHERQSPRAVGSYLSSLARDSRCAIASSIDISEESPGPSGEARSARVTRLAMRSKTLFIASPRKPAMKPSWATGRKPQDLSAGSDRSWSPNCNA